MKQQIIEAITALGKEIGAFDVGYDKQRFYAYIRKETLLKEWMTRIVFDHPDGIRVVANELTDRNVKIFKWDDKNLISDIVEFIRADDASYTAIVRKAVNWGGAA